MAELDERMGERLAKETQLRRARVARVSGVEEAFSEQYRKAPTSGDALAAFRAGDKLHMALREVGAEHVLGSLRRDITVGLASGRGVGFTIVQLLDLAERKPSWVRGYESIRVVSLCGGAHVGTWATPIHRDLDADENVFVLANILKVPPENVVYMYGWISTDPKRSEQEHHIPQDIQGIDLAVVGLGQLNTLHHFLHHYGEVQLGAVAEPLSRITDWQKKDEDLMWRVAEIGHNLFPVGGRTGLPEDFLTAIDEINEAIRVMPPKIIEEAPEIILVAGGAQKVHALLELVTGGCPEAPVNLSNLTLVTDTWTAEEILRGLGTRGRQT